MSTAAEEIPDLEDLTFEEDDYDPLEDEDSILEDLLRIETQVDAGQAALVKDLVEKIWTFLELFCDVEMFPYQAEFGKRLIESILLNDGETITALFSRQSGKTETVANVVATLMVLLPKLAELFPDLLKKFRNGFWVGTFAPIEQQAETLFGRIVGRLTSEHGVDIMLDPEIDDSPVGGGKFIRLKKSGSICRMHTANPRAKIESKSYHLIVIDEAQGADEFVVRKSIQPMGAFYNATVCKIGTPDVVKGDFYKTIQLNKRRESRPGLRRNHLEFDWRHCARYNPNYRKYVSKERLRIGEDSDEFQLSYELKWLLERGMFMTETNFDNLGDKSMQVVHSWWKSPVLVGIDPARKIDSTVVTVVWVDWDRPDEFGYFDHRVLNWLEMHGEDWEIQYHQICEFLSNYDVLAIGVDEGGIGDAMVSRLRVLLPRVEVIALGSSRPEQSKRWKHLTQLMQRERMGWPSHAKTRRLKVWRRFRQQMLDAEKNYEGPHMLVGAPDEAEAHDDFPDSLALACVLTEDMVMPEVEVSQSPFVQRRR